MRGGRSGSTVVQPLHRHNRIPLTRCNRMMAVPSRDWSVFKQIFADHWEPFQRTHPRYQTAYYDDLVAKMLDCGNPEKMGYLEYRCLQCGQGKHLVAMSCKSSLCLRCAKVSVDTWVSQVSRVLPAGVIYRHIILTVPAMFRTTFYPHFRTFTTAGLEIPAHLQELIATVVYTHDPALLAPVAAQVPDTFVDAVTLAGTVEEVATCVQ